MSQLVKEGALLVLAAENHPSEMDDRLEEGTVAGARTLLESLSGRTIEQAQSTSDLGEATEEQEDHIVVLLDYFGRAKDSAKRAFKGQQAKLTNEFKVGINTPMDLASVLERAGVVHHACIQAANAAALAKKGWIAKDTAALGAALATVKRKEEGQERSKIIRIGATDARNAAANELYETLLTIQNAATNEWPGRKEANRAVRREFRLDVFPPSPGGAKAEAASEPAAPKPKLEPVPV